MIDSSPQEHQSGGPALTNEYSVHLESLPLSSKIVSNLAQKRLLPSKAKAKRFADSRVGDQMGFQPAME